MSGRVIEQMQRFAPDVMELFQALAETGNVEFLGETYDHSLAFLYSRDEFEDQVRRHTALMQDLFGQTPTVFRNTELIYSNELGHLVPSLGSFRGVITEGADHVLAERSPGQLFSPPGLGDQMKLLAKNYRMSDDIAFRFSNEHWAEWPLTSEKFARWIHKINDVGDHVCNLFMDYETFGEHQWADTGIFEFLEHLPQDVLALGDDFKTPTECVDSLPVQGEFDAPHLISWADTERDLSAWLGNAMQSNALHELYKLEQPLKDKGDEQLLDAWRKLSSSDHFYYMCTKYFADGDVHRYFNPYESPYDSYINFMNVLDNLRSRVAD